MLRALILFVSLAVVTGCSGPMVQRLHVTSTHRFDPAERRAVWGRAVMSFQITGALVHLSDPVGGVLKSETQAGSARCSNAVFLAPRPRSQEEKECNAYQITQFTLTDDGTAFLRIGHMIWGQALDGTPLLSEDDEKNMQEKCDQMLLFIVGKSPVQPEPPPPPRAQSPGDSPPDVPLSI